MTSIQFPGNPSPFNGTFTATVVDNNGNPSNVLNNTTSDFKIDCSWEYSAFNILYGDWQVKAVVSDLSSGPDIDLPLPAPVASFPDGTLTAPKTATVTVPVGTLTPGGPYRVAVVLTHGSSGISSAIAAVEDGPLITVV